MSDSLGTFAFLPWLRRGVSTQISRRNDTPTPVPAQPRGTFDVTVPFSGPGGGTATVRGLALIGPGEVIGLDPGAIGRSWPTDGAADVESNYFPLLELGQADLPWRYTPASADLKDRLRPWCCLIAVKDDPSELVALAPAGPGRQLAVATITNGTPLPVLEQSWAWAHVEVTGVKAPTPADVAKIVVKQPTSVVARLLCPRKLQPRTWYRVLLVPAFKRGILAGLAKPVPANMDGMEPAWPAGQRTEPLVLPVYHQWRFLTGPGGDFEGLVDRLEKQPLPGTVGRRDMITGRSGVLPAASSAPLGVEGALQAKAMTPSIWKPAERNAWMAALGRVLARPADLLDGTAGTPRQVALPWYGRWHAALRTLTLPTPPPSPLPWPWHQELNTDPRFRVAAALGTLVVQSQQQQLMASAWRQAEGIRRINEELRLTQLAREQARRIWARHVAATRPDVVLSLTAPLHARVRRAPAAGTSTVRAALLGSPIDPGVFEAQFRRITRPLGPLGRRQGRPALPRTSDLLKRLNDGSLTAAAPPPIPAGLSRLDRAGITPERLQPDRVRQALGAAGFIPRELPPGGPAPPPPLRPESPANTDEPLRTATVGLFGDLIAPPAKPPVQTAVDLEELTRRMVDALDPAVTIGVACGGRVRLGPGQARDTGVDELEPVLAAPKFPQPMFEPLRDLSQDWLLPGLDKVPPNSVSLLVTNQRFIEAYMVGLNHEMARELLWNGFPTDQRGTCFDRFWDPSGSVPAAAAAAADIDPIAEWPPTGPLGANAPGGGPADAGRMVLLLRGDLLLRYPTAILYAAQAKPGPTFDLKAKEQHPSFSGTLQPDVSFFGFDLTVDQAAGTDGGAGWYFVFQEQPSETRFGLDDAEPDAASKPLPPMESWQDLTWAHMGKDVAYIDLDHAFDKPKRQDGIGWATHAADMAVITSQQPVRVAIHAARLLPGEQTPP